MKKIALVAPCNEYNYGTVLQAYALQRKVEEKGVEAEYLRYTGSLPPSFWKRSLRRVRDLLRSFRTAKPVYAGKGLDDYSFFRLPEFKPFVDGFERFIQARIKMSEVLYDPVSLRACREYDAYMTGSDQTWGRMRFRPRLPYFLENVDAKYPALSYAPSLGTTHIPQEFMEVLAARLPRFSALSCREKSNCEVLGEKLGREVTYVLDPALLLTADAWDTVAAPVEDGRLERKQYILCYILGEKACISDFAESLGGSKGLPVYYIVTRPLYLGKENHLFATPESFLSLVRDADTVVTDSFHGTVLSIDFNVQFYGFAKREAGAAVNDNDRILEFLHTLGLDNRFKADDAASFDDDIDYTAVNQEVARLRQASEDYLAATIKQCL